jgi:hypothetical protein
LLICQNKSAGVLTAQAWLAYFVSRLLLLLLRWGRSGLHGWLRLRWHWFLYRRRALSPHRGRLVVDGWLNVRQAARSSFAVCGLRHRPSASALQVHLAFFRLHSLLVSLKSI